MMMPGTVRNSIIAKLIVAIAAFCFELSASSASSAQTGSGASQSRVVPSGEKRQLAFLTSVNADCTVNGDMTVRIAKQTSHGVVEIDRALGYTNFVREDQRYECNLIPKEGYRVNYTSTRDFLGEDRFEIEFFSPQGNYSLWKYEVTVK
jgi:hypothetical protein